MYDTSCLTSLIKQVKRVVLCQPFNTCLYVRVERFGMINFTYHARVDC